MAKINALIHSFNAGELSKAGLARVDQDKVRLCAEVQENLMPYTIGKALMRPGTKYIGTLMSSTTLSNVPPRIIPFVKSLSTKSLMEITYPTGEVEEEEPVYEDVTTFYTTPGGASFTVPSGTTVITAMAIGGGGSGVKAGGGGGAYAYQINVSVTPGNRVYINVGATAGDSWVNTVGNYAPSSATYGVLAKGGITATTSTGALGGQAASCIGSTKYSGGNGGNWGGNAIHGCAGGGGAAGPSGAGKNGESPGSRQLGGGGGGSNNGTAGGTSDIGDGGNGVDGDGGGAAGIPGADGTNGGGGGGGAASQSSDNGDGGDGGMDSTFVAGEPYGSGGGGGGSGGWFNAEFGAGNDDDGGNGGLYGGGGGGGGVNGGVGAQGIVAITMSAIVNDSSSPAPGSLRIWNDDTLVSYPAVGSEIGALTGLTTTLTGGATTTLSATSFVSQAPYSGGVAIVKGEIATTSENQEHAIKIVIDYGSAEFRIGSTDGDDNYLSKTTLGEGSHILSFTPAGSYFIRFTITSLTEVSVSQCAIYNSSAINMSVPAPWVAGSLRSIRYDQSLDTVFMSIPDDSPHKVERRGAKSWSVVKYKSVDGPFMSGRSNSYVRLKPTATRGNTTLTADGDFFDDDHVGVIFKLTHSSLNATYGISAEGKYTPAFRQIGVVISAGTDDDRKFTVVVSGTWVGTLNIQRSYDGPDSGFRTYGSNITGNGTTTLNGSSNDDNAIIWYRVIFTTYTSGAAIVNINYPGYGHSGVCRIMAVNSATSADIEVISDFANTSYTEYWLEGEWSSRRGFPTAVALFDGRLWWARRDRFWGSESDDYYSFDVTKEGDAASIQRDVATGGTLSEIQWMMPLQRLLFGTAGAEASARASSLDEPLTPTAITVKDGSTQGASDVTPVKVDGRGLFMQRSRRRLMELAFGPSINDYMATDLTRYNETACTALGGERVTGLVDSDVTELAVQRHPDTYVYILRDDGVIPCLIYNPSQEVTGWFKITLGRSTTSFGSYLKHDRAVSVAVLPEEIEDEVYFIVQRRTDPDTYSYFLEKLVQHQQCTYSVLTDQTENEVTTYNGLHQLDSYETSVINADGETINVTSRLDGSTVMVIGPHYDTLGNIVSYGPIGETYDLDGTGVITLDDADLNRAGAAVTIGLPYTGRYKSAKLAYGAQAGTSLMQKKRISQVGLLLSDYNPAGITIGPDFDNMDDLPAVIDGVDVDYDSSLISVTDTDMFPFPGEWSTDARLCIEISPGYSATLNGIVIGVENNER